jgi:transcriptional regulator with XRE-family HTH domain
MDEKGIIERIKLLMQQFGDSANAFAKRVDIDPGNLRRKLKGQSPITSRDIVLISTAINVNREWLTDGTGNIWNFCKQEQEEQVSYPATEIASESSARIENSLLREQIEDLRRQVDFLQSAMKAMLTNKNMSNM